MTSRKVTGGVRRISRGTFGRQQLTISGRHDDNSQFATKNTGSAAWGYHLTQDLRFIASYGTAFHAPSFNDLYYPFFGNPDLKPATSRPYELGLEQRLQTAHWSVHAFDTRVHDFISYDAALFAPENTDEARIGY